AQEACRKCAKGSTPIRVLVREGTYYLESPLRFLPEDSGTSEAQVIYAAYLGEKVTLSGGRELICNWVPYKAGIMMASIPPGLEFTQLFVNSKRQIRAR